MDRLDIKIFISLVIILLLSCSEIHQDKKEQPNESESGIQSLDYLLGYNGKYQNEEKLFKTEPLASRLKDVVGAGYQFFNSCDIELPIRVKNNNVIFEGCKNYECSKLAYAVYVDIEKDSIFVGMFEKGEVYFFPKGQTNLPLWLTEWENSKRIIYEEEQAKNYSTSSENEEDTYNYESSREYLVGEVVSVGNFGYVVDNISFAKTIENYFSTPEADGIYLIVNMRVVNTTRESRNLTKEMFKVIDSGGFEFGTSETAMASLFMSEQDKVLSFKEIPPKIPKEITIAFEVPDSRDTYKLRVSGGFWTNKTAHIKLN